ncbi:MAG TPA: GTP-binding protein [Ghiorsea sp.]|nr:GTP-binding protein [Ghiorsea sp.]HIP07288.1 GTP-binding protein [Mariprofundaceae bacterium]
MIQKKICILGAAGVGKTSLTAQFVYSKFSEKYLSSMGVKIDRKVVHVDETDVNLMIWDVHGEEKYKKIPTSYLRGASGILMVIDGTRIDTVAVAEEVRQRVLDKLGDVPFVYLLNKSDLQDAWSINENIMQQLQVTGSPILLTSAKTGDNVETAFSTIAKAMLPT